MYVVVCTCMEGLYIYMCHVTCTCMEDLDVYIRIGDVYDKYICDLGYWEDAHPIRITSLPGHSLPVAAHAHRNRGRIACLARMLASDDNVSKTSVFAGAGDMPLTTVARHPRGDCVAVGRTSGAIAYVEHRLILQKLTLCACTSIRVSKSMYKETQSLRLNHIDRLLT